MSRTTDMRSVFARSFMLGVVSGSLAVALSFLVRYSVGGIFLPEFASQTFFAVVPGAVESSAVERLAGLAKYLTFGGAIVLNILLYGVVAVFVCRIYGRWPDRRYGSLAFRVGALAYGFFLVFALLVSVLAASVSQYAPIAILALSALPPNLLFGLVFPYAVPRIYQRQEVVCVAAPGGNPTFDRKRRLFIKTATAGAVALALLAYGLDLLFSKISTPSATGAEVTQISSLAVTPNDNFYRVDIDIVPPSVDGNSWRLKIGGLVDTPTSISLDQLMALPAAEQYNTLECVSNEIGGDLISTAKWRGVRLVDLLRTAGVHADAAYAVFTCADGYDVAIPKERALLDGTILAYGMNGLPLPVEHGYPLRAVVPGLYGMMNAKWVEGIQVVANQYQGYWQRRGWTSDARYQTGSTIVTPGDSPVRAERFGLPASLGDVVLSDETIAGIAFAGDAGISKVEVSTDGGYTWKVATVKDPLSQCTWVLWSADWNPPKEGSYQLIVRATNKSGLVQTATVSAPFPSGATGYHVVDVTVEKAAQTTT